MDTKIKIKDYRTVIESTAAVKPYFLSSSTLDCMIFEEAKPFFIYLGKLFVDKVLTPRQINSIVISINGVFDRIVEISTPVSLFYFSYIEQMLIHLKRATIEDELYEISSNIDRFLKIYQTI